MVQEQRLRQSTLTWWALVEQEIVALPDNLKLTSIRDIVEDSRALALPGHLLLRLRR